MFTFFMESETLPGTNNSKILKSGDKLKIWTAILCQTSHEKILNNQDIFNYQVDFENNFNVI